MKEINHNDPMPLYYQLEKVIKEAISIGELKPGDLLPTEPELMDIFSISRATVRHAIQNLENEGYLRKERAKGTFIKYPPIQKNFLGNLKCFSEEMQRKGIPHSTTVLKNEIIKAEASISEKLQVQIGSEIFYLKRLRKVDSSPILIVESYLPYDLFPGIEKEDFNQNSLYDTMESRYKILLCRGHRVIEPKIVRSGETMELLEIEPGTCISAIESTIYNTDNRPVEHLYAEMNGKISIDLG
ncbi:MAG: GntR family transcriptional regulator [Anaerolineales bacterium]|nr:GntR family transcriptional regulator [Anaerolineales bacterium]